MLASGISPYWQLEFLVVLWKYHLAIVWYFWESHCCGSALLLSPVTGIVGTGDDRLLGSIKIQAFKICQSVLSSKWLWRTKSPPVVGMLWIWGKKQVKMWAWLEDLTLPILGVNKKIVLMVLCKSSQRKQLETYVLASTIALNEKSTSWLKMARCSDSCQQTPHPSLMMYFHDEQGFYPFACVYICKR